MYCQTGTGSNPVNDKNEKTKTRFNPKGGGWDDVIEGGGWDDVIEGGGWDDVIEGGGLG